MSRSHASRLDRLLLLLESDGSTLIRKLAAEQFGQLVDQSEYSTPQLLQRV